jgi:sugar transferase EpsL
MYQRLKRGMDVAGAVLGLIIAGPLMLAIAVAVRLATRGPILFDQERPGLHGRLFRCLKFRTMTDERDATGAVLPDEQRLTRVGSILRRTSLDELPQLFNILWGDLSFVGPRPLLKEYLPYYTAEENRRHTVRPGLTGWAQIHGRNDLDFDRRLALDVWYVDHVSWKIDAKILLATVWLILSRRGSGLDTHPPLNEERRDRLQSLMGYSPADTSGETY